MSGKKLEPAMELENIELKTGPFAPLKMPEQDLSAGESMLSVVRQRLTAARLALLTGRSTAQAKALSKPVGSATER